MDTKLLQQFQSKFVSIGKSTVNFKTARGATFSRKWKMIKKRKHFSVDGHEFVMSEDDTKLCILNGSNVIEAKAQTINGPIQSEFHIDTRFDFLEKFSNMVISNVTASLLVTGEGGLGKSHTVMEMLEKAGLSEEQDFKVIKGYSTPKALYATLFENKDKLIIFDDCDSILRDPTALNILKGALDSYDVRTVSWLARGFVDDGLPDNFIFNGQVIFISNMKLANIDGAVRSRTMAVDLSMTTQDKIDRMRTILPKILPDYDMSIKVQALNFIELHKDEAVDLNMRTLQKISKVVKAYDGDIMWQQASKYLLTNV